MRVKVDCDCASPLRPLDSVRHSVSHLFEAILRTTSGRCIATTDLQGSIRSTATAQPAGPRAFNRCGTYSTSSVLVQRVWHGRSKVMVTSMVPGAGE
jgi:hypothetical protein